MYFRDNYIYEPAAYQLSLLLGLDNVPPATLRKIDNKNGSVQIWVENAMTERRCRSRNSSRPTRSAVEQAAADDQRVRRARVQHRPQQRQPSGHARLEALDDRPHPGFPPESLPPEARLDPSVRARHVREAQDARRGGRARAAQGLSLALRDSTRCSRGASCSSSGWTSSSPNAAKTRFSTSTPRPRRSSRATRSKGRRPGSRARRSGIAPALARRPSVARRFREPPLRRARRLAQELVLRVEAGLDLSRQLAQAERAD